MNWEKMAMDKQNIINELKQVLGETFAVGTGPEPQRGPNCLEPEAIAALLNRGPKAVINNVHKTHLADCPFCLQQLARICRSREEDTTGVSSELLLQAEALGAGAAGLQVPGTQRVNSRPLRGSFPAVVAIAATVVLAIGIMLVNFKTGDPVTLNPEDFKTSRNVDSGAMNLRVLAPVSASLILPAEQVFRWTEVPGALFYDVRLVDPEGELLLRERLKTTRWLIPESLHLEPGNEYYVRVDAYLDDEQFLSSEHVVFGVRDEQ